MADGLFGSSISAPQLQQTRIQPAGTPGGTFVRAPEVQTGGNLRALADALGGLNSALNGYVQARDQIRNDPDSRENKEWIAQREQMSLEQLQEEVRLGTANGIRIREDALNALLGARANTDFRLAWAEFYETSFDRTNGDASAEYERMRQEFAEALPSEIARGNFYRLTGQHYEAAMAASASERLEHARQQVGTTIVDGWHTEIGDMISAGELDAAQIAEQVFASSAANRDFLGLSGQEQNATVWALAERLALEGDVDLAEALLMSSRTGANGETIPSLASIPEYTSRAHSLLDRAKNIRLQNARESEFDLQLSVRQMVEEGSFTETSAALVADHPLYADASVRAGLVAQSAANRARIEAQAARDDLARANQYAHDAARDATTLDAMTAMGRHGGVNNLRDVEIPRASGTGSETYTRQQQIEAVTERMESAWRDEEDRLVANGESEESARQAVDAIRLGWYAQNGLTNETWRNRLRALPQMATPDTFAENPEALAYYVETAEFYRTLSAQNPAYADSLLDGPSREFLETYNSAITFWNMPPEDAMAHTVGWLQRPDRGATQRQVSPTEITEIISNVMSTSGAGDSGGLFRSATYDDRSLAIVGAQVHNLANMGLSQDVIQRDINRWVSERAHVVNGAIMIADRPLPPDFSYVSSRFLEGVLSRTSGDDGVTYGEAYGIESADDLFLQPDPGHRRWQVWSKSLGIPLGDVWLTENELSSVRAQIEAEDEAGWREAIEAANASRAEGGARLDEHIREIVQTRYFTEMYRIENLRASGTAPNIAAADAAEETLRRYMEHFPDFEVDEEAFHRWMRRE